MKIFCHGLLLAGLMALGMGVSPANPQGGQVSAGSAAINTVPGTVTVNQQSNTAIINWQSFSIGAGEATNFIQPSAASAVLNRVLGGQTSIINGTLSANGQVYLINGNGILVGPTGTVNAAGFTASTRDIADSDFLSGNLHFTGSGDAGVQNLGTVNALGGNVVFIGKTVDNQGTINAPNGVAGLVAGDDVLLAQKNADGSTIMVNPTTTATSAITQVGVHNSGTITAASAELKAANGNIYALAIQNEGSIRATTVQHQGGRIFLTSDTGTVVNSGTLDASATAAKGKGGIITLKSAKGTAVESGKILARGGQGGAGGNAEVSGNVVQFSGTVDLSASGGTTGDLLFDPENVIIQTAGPSTTTPSGGPPTDTFTGGVDDSILTVSDLENALENSNITVTTGTTGTQSGNITVANALNWSSSNTLTLTAANDISLNAAITIPNGGLTLNASNNIYLNAPIFEQFGVLALNANTITSGSEASPSATGVTANINVNSFYLQSGNWVQNSANLPSFNGGNDFEIQNSSSFLRVTGGDGSTGNPYQITDVWGLQGLGSPSNNYLGSSAELMNNIDAILSGAWNEETGLVPIGNSTNPYTGTFNGQGFQIANLEVNAFGDYAGLFGASSGTIENVGLTNITSFGFSYVGGLVGLNQGLVKNSYVSGMFGLVGATTAATGGLVGENDGTIQNSYSAVTVSPADGSTDTGGLVGINTGMIQDSFSASPISFNTGMGDSIGGLVGHNTGTGTIKNSYSSAPVDAGASATDIGGLVGLNDGLIQTSYSTSLANGSSDGTNVGGLVGVNNGTVETTYTTGTVEGNTLTVGGVVGINNSSGTILNSYFNSDANPADTGIGTNMGTFTNVVGESLAALMMQATFTPAGSTGAPNWDFTNDWIMIEDQTTPLLRALSTTISGTTFFDSGLEAAPDDPVQLLSQGQVQATTMSSGTGGYSFLIPADQAVSGVLLVDPDQASNTFYSSALPISPTVSGIDLWASTLRIVGTGTATNTAIAQAVGGQTTGIIFTPSGNGNNGYDLMVSTGDVDVEGPLSLDGNIAVTADGATFSSTASGALTLFNLTFGEPLGISTTSGDITLNGPVYSSGILSLSTVVANINLQSAITGPGGVQLNSGLGISDTAAVSIDTFILQGGNWTQLVDDGTNGGNIVGSLPAFSVGSDFELQAGTFLRATGGDGSMGNPYQITDIYGLEGLGSPSENLSFSNANLVNNIDATGTVTWNNGAGFTPIGDSDQPYGGTFNGQTFSVNGLTIDGTDSPNHLGLFGISSGTIENVVMTNVNIAGFNYIGGLVGTNTGPGTVLNSSVSGIITQGDDGSQTGGLVGQNNGQITGSTSTATVTGNTTVGGLVGENSSGATISTSSSSGPVNGVVGGGGDGSDGVGGLVGENDGTVQTSFSTSTVVGDSESQHIGGLVGDNENLVTTSNSSGSVSGHSQVGGLVGFGNSGSTISNSSSTDLVTGIQDGIGDGAVAIGGLVGDNGGTVETSFSTSIVSADPLSSQVGGLVGLNLSLVMTSFSSGSVTGDVQVGGLVGQNFSGATVMDSYSTALVTGMVGGDSVGGLVGENDSLVETSYSIGPVMGGGATNVGGLVGNNTDTVTASFWATDTSGQATSAGGAGAIPVTAAQLTDYNTYVMAGVVGTGAGQWDFTVGTGAWGVNVIDSTGPLNGGLPILQAMTPINAQVQANDQVVVYGQAPDLTTAYTVVQGSLAGALASGPFLAIGGPNTDVGTSNPILIGGMPNTNFVVEFINGTETFSPATLTITGAVAADKIYDQTMTATLSSTGTLSGLVGTDFVSLDASGYSANFAAKDVGSSLAVTVTGYVIEGGDSGNYTLTQPTGLTANITPAPITITGAVAANKVYDQTAADTLTSFGTLNGVITGDVVTLDTTAYTANFPSKNAGNNLAVTVAGYALGGMDGGDYMVTQPTGLTANITPAPLTITGAVAANKTYNQTTAGTLSSFGALNGVILGDTVTLNTAAYTANFATPNVANNIGVTVAGYALGGTDGGNYTVTQPTGLTANITAAMLTVTGAVAGNKIYDQTTADTLTSFGTLSGVIPGDTVTLNTAAYAANFGTVNVGNNLGVTVTGYALGGAQGGNYIVTQPAGLTANITAAMLTVTGAVAGNKVYDQTTTDTLTSFGSLSGVIPGDTVTLNTAAYAANFGTVNVGNNLGVTVTGYALGGAQGGNYIVTQPAGLTANITAAMLTVTGAVAGNKVYDQTTTDTLTSFGSLVGVIPGDTVTLDTSAYAANFGTVNVGNNLGVTVTGYALGGAQSGNYTVTQPTGLTANITAALLTITGAVATDKIYDQTATDTLTSFGTLTGIIPGDTVTLDTTAYAANFPSKNAGNNLAVTVTGYALGGAQGGNYTITQPTGLTANLTQAPLTVTGTVASDKVYDGTPTATLTNFGTLNGVIPGDTVTIDSTGYAASFPSKNVGNNLNVAIIGYGLGGTDAGNYAITLVAGATASITAAPLTITGAVAGDKIYDQTTTAPLTSFGALSGVIPGDTVTLDTTAYTANFPAKDVGNNLAVAVAGYALGGADSGNYTVTQPTGLTANITPVTLTITGAVAGDKIYDQTTTAPLTSFGTLSGVIPGDTVTLNTAAYTANFPSKNAGNNLAVTVAGYALGGMDGGDYVVTQPTGLTANIAQAALTITGAVAGDKVYDGTTAETLTNLGTLSGVIPGDTVNINAAAYNANFASANAGNNLGVTVTGYALGGTDAANYTITQPTDLTANITLAPLDITANDAVKTSDGTPFSGGNGVSYNGFVNGETPAVLNGQVVYSGTSQGAITIGNYAITPGGFDSSNYAIAYHNGNLAIIPAVVPGTVITPQTASIIASVLSGAIDAPIPTATGLGLTPPAIDVAVVLADDPSILGGAINTGAEDTGTYIAFGSSVSSSGMPTLFRLLVGGAGTSIISNGYVTWIQPPANILNEFEQIFSAAVQQDLQLAASTGNLAGGVTGSIPGAPPYVLLLTPGGGAVVVSDGVVSPGQPPTLVIREFNTIFSADLQNQLQNAVTGSE